MNENSRKGRSQGRPPTVFVGDVFGKLTVVAEATERIFRQRAWICRCECGNGTVVPTQSLRSGKTRSCGCLARENEGQPQSVFVGDVYGRLTVVTEERAPGNRYFECDCECGNTVRIRGDSLRDGSTQSCGCLGIERRTTANQVRASHGHMRGSKGSPTHNSWASAYGRCHNPNHTNWVDYGGRGIVMCDRWRHDKGGGFLHFLADMGERPEGKTLDRIDVNGNYEPENCQWADLKQQGQNKRRRITLGLVTEAAETFLDVEQVVLLLDAIAALR